MKKSVKIATEQEKQKNDAAFHKTISYIIENTRKDYPNMEEDLIRRIASRAIGYYEAEISR